MSLDPKTPPEWRLLDFKDKTHKEPLLMDSFMCEKNDICGWDVEFYLHKDSEVEDTLYGEDTNEEWDGPFRSKVLYEPTEEPSSIDAFGFASDDVVQYAQVPKTIWQRDVEDELQKVRAPIPKDLVKTLWNDKTYEIVDVGAEEFIFQGRKMTWSFILRPWRFADQSDSAKDILFEDPNVDDFPYENVTIESFSPSAYDSISVSGTGTDEITAYHHGTIPTSAQGDNEYIEEESDKIWNDPNKTSAYDYDTYDDDLLL